MIVGLHGYEGGRTRTTQHASRPAIAVGSADATPPAAVGFLALILGVGLMVAGASVGGGDKRIGG